MALDKKRRQWARKIEGVPSVYRARTWPYKGKRRLVKIYKEDGTVIDVEGSGQRPEQVVSPLVVPRLAE